MPEELWTVVCVAVQETEIKTIPKKTNAKRRGLTNSCEKKRRERQRRKEKIYPFECSVPKNPKDRQEAFLSDQCKEIEENNRMGKTRNLLKKIKRYQGNISCKDVHNKLQKLYVPKRNRRY